MKQTSILFCLLFAITANLFTTAKAQVNTTDSLALVDLYNNTSGPHWYNHTNWLTTAPVSTWAGIAVTNNIVTDLYLTDNNLSGTLPSSIGNIIYLSGLFLDHNHLSGSIPAEIGKLSELTYLELNDNQLSGAIPAEIGNIIYLRYLYLDHNQLSGSIPAEIGNLVYLYELVLDHNQLTGAIPAEIGGLQFLYYLHSGNNQLSGAIPAEIGSLKSLINLDLSYNELSGTVPASLKKLKNLGYIDISHNQLSAFGYSNSFTSPDHKFTGYVNNNLFTFDGLQVIAKNFHKIVYAPQNTILPIHQSGSTLSVYAGGTLGYNIYKWFKVGSVDSATIYGDSTFTPSAGGKYFAQVKNYFVKGLVLYSDTFSYTMPLAQTQNSVANITAVKAFTNHFSVYPNPAKDVIHVQVNGNAIVTLTNSSGKILLSKTITNSGAINVSGYANGVYYLQNKTTGETQKVIIIH